MGPEMLLQRPILTGITFTRRLLHQASDTSIDYLRERKADLALVAHLGRRMAVHSVTGADLVARGILVLRKSGFTSFISKRRPPTVEHADTLSLKALRDLAMGLAELADRSDIRIERLEAKNQSLRDENDDSSGPKTRD